MTDVRQRIDRLVPELHEQGDWAEVLADAAAARRRRLRLMVPPVVAAAVISVLALAWPFGSERPAGVLDRALAAIGDGSALHIVYRDDWGPMSVDLTTGDVTKLIAESELWYDPKRGIHRVWRVDGNVRGEHLTPPRQLSARQEESLVALADNYRSALRSGSARVIGPGHVEGRPVIWIRARSEWLPDTSDGRNHLFAEEVAVDRDTYEPVYARSTRDGRAFPGGGQAIAELEQVAPEDADFDVDQRTRWQSWTGGNRFGKLLEAAEYDEAVGGPAFWLGRSHDGKPLADAREYAIRRRPGRDAAWVETRGLYLFYGKLPRKNDLPLRALSPSAVVLEEFREIPELWFGWADAAVAREGSVVVSGRSGIVLRDGTYILVRAPTVHEILGAAFALRGIGDPAPARPALDIASIARQVETRLERGSAVSGGKPVQPRPIARTRGKLVQTTTRKGVSVRLYSGGVARFDTRNMEPSLQRAVPRDLGWHCFRVRGDQPQGGGIGPIPRDGVKWATVLGHGSRGRTPILRPPFDACELGTGFGRNWLPRFGWHGPLEIPLTKRGSRFFEERAAARELAAFVRSGPMARARRAMKRGASAPAAERLLDRSRPYIEVTSHGDRIRASLVASTGRRFFIEIRRGRIGRKNVGLPLVFVY